MSEAAEPLPVVTDQEQEREAAAVEVDSGLLLLVHDASEWDKEQEKEAEPEPEPEKKESKASQEEKEGRALMAAAVAAGRFYDAAEWYAAKFEGVEIEVDGDIREGMAERLAPVLAKRGGEMPGWMKKVIDDWGAEIKAGLFFGASVYGIYGQVRAEKDKATAGKDKTEPVGSEPYGGGS